MAYHLNRKNLRKIREAGGDLFTALCRGELGVECVREYRFHPQRRWRFDYAFVEQRVALEVEGGVWTGGRHVSPKGFLGDIEKYNAAAMMGWMVLRVVPADLHGRRTLEMLRRALEGKGAASDAARDEEGRSGGERRKGKK